MMCARSRVAASQQASCAAEMLTCLCFAEEELPAVWRIACLLGSTSLNGVESHTLSRRPGVRAGIRARLSLAAVVARVLSNSKRLVSLGVTLPGPSSRLQRRAGHVQWVQRQRASTSQERGALLERMAIAAPVILSTCRAMRCFKAMLTAARTPIWSGCKVKQLAMHPPELPIEPSPRDSLLSCAVPGLSSHKLAQLAGLLTR